MKAQLERRQLVLFPSKGYLALARKSEEVTTRALQPPSGALQSTEYEYSEIDLQDCRSST